MLASGFGGGRELWQDALRDTLLLVTAIMSSGPNGQSEASADCSSISLLLALLAGLERAVSKSGGRVRGAAEAGGALGCSHEFSARV